MPKGIHFLRICSYKPHWERLVEVARGSGIQLVFAFFYTFFCILLAASFTRFQPMGFEGKNAVNPVDSTVEAVTVAISTHNQCAKSAGVNAICFE